MTTPLDSGTVYLGCPECRAAAKLPTPPDLTSWPARYYECPTCGDEWCTTSESAPYPGPWWEVVLVILMVAYMISLFVAAYLGATLLLRYHLGWSYDAAIGGGALTAFLAGIVLVPLSWQVIYLAQRAGNLVWGEPL